MRIRPAGRFFHAVVLDGPVAPAMHPAVAARLYSLLLPLLIVGGCGLAGPLTYGEMMQTAAAQGCWEGTARTPLPVTVSPSGGQSLTTTPTVVSNPGAPTRTPAPSATPVPSTTALPRCTPAPGTTLEPWPSSRPTQPPLPTRAADLRQPMVDGETVMRLPNALLALDLAVHPVQNWPAVAAVDIPVVNRDHARVFVRAYEPRGGGWGDSQTVDTEGSHPGERFRSVALGVTGDGTLHAVWGVTDFPELAMFASESHDRGKHWSSPTRLGGGLFGVLDMATTLDNQVFVLAMQRDPELAPVIFRRGADGRWGEREVLPLEHVWYASGGALVVAGDGLPGVEPHLVAMLTGDEAEAGTVYVLRRPLSGGVWSVGSRSLSGAEVGVLPGAVRGLAYTWRQGQTAAPAVSFTFTMRDTASVLALTSLDGGVTWGSVEPVARSGQASVGASGTYIQSAAPAYDPVAQSLIAVWTCCKDGLWGNAESTHYASWRPISSPAWAPELRPETFWQRVPLVTGSSAAGLTAVEQAANSRVAWMAWVEDGQAVRVRTLPLDRMLPGAAYPTITPTATPLRTQPTTGRP